MRNKVVVVGILVIISGFALFIVSRLSSTTEYLRLGYPIYFNKVITVPFRENALIEKFWLNASLEGWTSYAVLFFNYDSDFSQYSVNITGPNGENIPAMDYSRGPDDRDYNGWDFSFKTKSEGLYNFLVEGTYLTTKAEIDETIIPEIWKLEKRTLVHNPYGSRVLLQLGAADFWVIGIVISIIGLRQKRRSSNVI